MSRTRTVTGLVAAGAAALALSACGGHPGSAAVVGSQPIDDARVDAFARALCYDPQVAGQQTPRDLPSRTVRRDALTILLTGELNSQFAASLGVEPDQELVSAAVAANSATIEALPAGRREVFRQVLEEYAEGQLSLLQVGRAALASQGGQGTDQQAIAAGTQLRDRWAARNVEVSVDPRFGSYRSGQVVNAGDGSLSVPVSRRATAGAAAQPDAAYAAALPASQKCS
ncbi:MAG: hypothetical protein WB441_09625 [Nocardioidaceae bacterium]